MTPTDQSRYCRGCEQDENGIEVHEHTCTVKPGHCPTCDAGPFMSSIDVDDCRQSHLPACDAVDPDTALGACGRSRGHEGAHANGRGTWSDPESRQQEVGRESLPPCGETYGVACGDCADCERARIVAIVTEEIPHDGHCSMDDCGGCEALGRMLDRIKAGNR